MSDNKDIDDSLGLAQNANIQKVLAKYLAKGETEMEKVVFSDYVSKINRKDKTQTRVMLITNRGLFLFSSFLFFFPLCESNVCESAQSVLVCRSTWVGSRLSLF